MSRVMPLPSRGGHSARILVLRFLSPITDLNQWALRLPAGLHIRLLCDLSVPQAPFARREIQKRHN
jgi:hypothetical protein